MKIILLAAFLLVCSLSFTINNIVTDDGRVKVDFYYESLCPYCQQYMERSLKVASQTKVNIFLFRISGRYAISTFIPTEMPIESRMDQAGTSHVNMDQDNAKETWLRLAPLRNTIFTPRPFHSLFVWKVTPVTGLLVERNAHKPTTWTGTRFNNALHLHRACNIS